MRFCVAPNTVERALVGDGIQQCSTMLLEGKVRLRGPSSLKY